VSPAFGATDVPDPPDASDNFAQRWSFTDEEQLFGVVRAEFDVTNTVAVWGAAGMRNGDEHNVLANPSAQANGTTSTYRFDNTREDDVYSGELGVRWDFETGPVEHRVIVSGSLYSLDSKNAYAFSNFAGFPGDLYDPVQVPPPAPDFFTGGDLDNPRTTEDTDTYSYAIADMLRFADGRFILTVGARHQNLKTETFDYNTHARASHYDESKVTPVGGIVYRPSESLSFFANYIEGLDAGGIAPTVTFDGLPVTNGGQALDPSQTQQFEAGVKYDAGDFGATLSLFNVESSFGILEPFDDPSTPTDDAIFRDDGEQRNRGVELSIFGEPFEHLRVIGGATFLDADMTETEGGVNEGNTPIGAPQTQLNLNVEWDVAALAGLTLEARGMYTSSQYADGANTLVIDSWTRFDIGARYSTEVAGRPLALRARVDNVTDENDWISAGGYPGFGYFVLGAPRTFVLSASVDF
jgi:iron complex outermembrane receptor protein